MRVVVLADTKDESLAVSASLSKRSGLTVNRFDGAWEQALAKHGQKHTDIAFLVTDSSDPNFLGVIKRTNLAVRGARLIVIDNATGEDRATDCIPGISNVVAMAEVGSSAFDKLVDSAVKDATLSDRFYDDVRVLRALYSNTEDALIILENRPTKSGGKADYKIVHASQAVSSLFGLYALRVYGRSARKSLPPQLIDTIAREVEMADNGTVLTTRVEFETKTDHGDTAATCYGVTLMTSGTHIYVALRDMSTLRQLETKVVTLAEDLLVAERSTESMHSALSYEIRTPLNSIIGFADLMMVGILGPLPNAKYRTYTDDIAKAGRTMMDIVDRMLGRGQLEHLTMAEAGYRHIIHLAPDLICICRDGKIDLINPAGANMLGIWPKEELVGRQLADFAAPDDRAQLADGLEALAVGGNRVPVRFIRSDGQEVAAEMAAVHYQEDDETPGIMVVARDVTDRKRATDALAQGEERLRRILDTVADGIITVDENLTIESFNPAAESIFGYNQTEVVGMAVGDLIAGQVVDMGGRDQSFTVAGPEVDFQERVGLRKDGSVFPAEIVVTNMTLGPRTVFIAAVRDITKRKRDEERLLFLATRDPLTKLPNYAMFRDELEDALAEAKADGKLVGILFIDLDNFKSINDTLGHPVGDLLLQEAGKRLCSCVRDHDTVARQSGDEFTIILRGVKSEDDSLVVAETMLDKLAKPFEIEGRQIYTTGSIGLTHFPTDGENISDLMRNVDTAAYHAKAVGRNVVQQFTDTMREGTVRRHAIDSGLRKALELGELEVWYQPQILFETGEILGAEALLRWNSVELGRVSPVEFIPVAEETGLIVAIGEWVLERACEQSARWQTYTENGFNIAVNVSARQFRESDLASRVAYILTNSGLNPKRLEIELTESVFMENAESATDTLNALKDKGVKVSLDDFGTGYSSLGYLQKFPIDTVKIDRSFIKDIPDNVDDMAITKAIIGLSHSLGLRTVAEGVETPEQISYLKSLNCDIAQGFYYSPPVPAAEFELLLKNGWEKSGQDIA